MQKTTRLAGASLLIFCSLSTANATLLINEIDYDQPKRDTAEFIELFNSGTTTLDLSGYRLDLINGKEPGGALYRSFALDGYRLAAGGYLVICGNASLVANCAFDAHIGSGMIQNGAPDGIILRNGQAIVDAMTYEGEIPGITKGSQGAPADTSAGIMSIGRLPNGRDHGDNATDFVRNCITPGTANRPGQGDCSTVAGATLPLPPVPWLLGCGLFGMAAIPRKEPRSRGRNSTRHPKKEQAQGRS